MTKLLTVTCFGLLLLCSGCGQETSSVTDDPDRIYAEQLLRYKQQADKTDEQDKRIDQQLDKANEQDRRFDALLTRWEQQADRQDRILTEQERRLGIEPAKQKTP